MARAWVYGDNVDTDVIIPARYLITSNPAELAPHALEDLDPAFAGGVEPGDVVFAGANFGCGSSREHAPLALKGAGVAAVVAHSFARIFYRNAINTGLPIFICPDVTVQAGDRVEVDGVGGQITNLDTGATFTAEPMPAFVSEIARAGGLVPWVRTRLEAAR